MKAYIKRKEEVEQENRRKKNLKKLYTISQEKIKFLVSGRVVFGDVCKLKGFYYGSLKKRVLIVCCKHNS